MTRVYLWSAVFCAVIFAGLVVLFMEVSVRRHGDVLALVASPDDANGIFVLDLPTRILHRLTPPEIRATNPLWSPDGSQLLITTVWDGNEQALMLMDANGGNLTEIQRFDRSFGLAGQAAWANDGKTILFVAFQNSERRVIRIDLPELSRRRADEDSALVQHYLEALNRITQGQYSTPDGQRTVTVSPVGGRWALLLIDLQSDAPQPQVLTYIDSTAIPNFGLILAISNDGEQVAFRDVAESGEVALFVLEIDEALAGNASRRQVTFGGGVFPAWQP